MALSAEQRKQWDSGAAWSRYIIGTGISPGSREMEMHVQCVAVADHLTACERMLADIIFEIGEDGDVEEIGWRMLRDWRQRIAALLGSSTAEVT